MAPPNKMRRHPRLSATVPILIESPKGAVYGESIDISHDGVGLRADEFLELHGMVTLTIPRTSTSPMKLRGQVAHRELETDSDGMGLAGVRLQFLGSSDYRRWSDFVRMLQLRAHASGSNEDRPLLWQSTDSD